MGDDQSDMPNGEAVSPYNSITVAQANEVMCFVDQARPWLGLERHKLLLRSRGSDVDYRAQVHDTDGRHVSVLTVTPTMWEAANSDMRRHDMVHELLHCAHARLSQAVFMAINSFTTNAGEDRVLVAKEVVQGEFEWFVDEMTTSIYPLIPVYWPTPDVAAQYAAQHGWDLAFHKDLDAAF